MALHAIIDRGLKGLLPKVWTVLLPQKEKKIDREMDGVSTCSILQKQRNMSEAQRRGEQPHL